MAKNVIVKQYATPADQTVKAITAVVPRLGYALRNVDNNNGIVNFESGASLWSNRGEALSAHVLEMSGNSQVTITGAPKGWMGPLDMMFNVRDTEVIATKVFEELDKTLGQGQLISGQLKSGSRRNTTFFVIIAILLLCLCLVTMFPELLPQMR